MKLRDLKKMNMCTGADVAEVLGCSKGFAYQVLRKHKAVYERANGRGYMRFYDTEFAIATVQDAMRKESEAKAPPVAAADASVHEKLDAILAAVSELRESVLDKLDSLGLRADLDALLSAVTEPAKPTVVAPAEVE